MNSFKQSIMAAAFAGALITAPTVRADIDVKAAAVAIGAAVCAYVGTRSEVKMENVLPAAYGVLSGCLYANLAQSGNYAGLASAMVFNMFLKRFYYGLYAGLCSDSETRQQVEQNMHDCDLLGSLVGATATLAGA